MKFVLPKICLPAKIYLGLSVLSIILGLLMSVDTATYSFVHLLFAIFWTWLLNLICKSGFTPVSWFLVLFPIIIYFAIILFAVYKTNQMKKMMNDQQKKENFEQKRR